MNKLETIQSAFYEADIYGYVDEEAEFNLEIFIQVLEREGWTWTSYKLQRGICSVCGKDLALRKDGLIRTHDPLKEEDLLPIGYGCQGQGKPPRTVNDRTT